MNQDRVREMKAWANVLVANCEEYLNEPSSYRTETVTESMRNLAICMDRTLGEIVEDNS